MIDSAKFELWFFRDCNAGTRRCFFSLFGMPVEELVNDGLERIALRHILALSTPAVAQPDGMVLVPREPTPEMIRAASETPGIKEVNSIMSMHQGRGYEISPDAFPDNRSALNQAWDAMIAAAPQVPVGEGG